MVGLASGSLWQYIDCDWQIRNSLNPPFPRRSVPLSALPRHRWGAAHEGAAGWLHMRVPGSCELETTADLQIPEEIPLSIYRLMANCAFFASAVN